jgi:sorbitol/mannitol transport system permease protein
LLAWVIGILFVMPILWMVLTSLHSESDAATNPPSVLAPLTLSGYREFFGASSGASPWPTLANSLSASVLSTVVVLLLSIPAAYALSIRPVRKWTDVMFFFLSTKMLPVVAALLPIYLILQNLKLLDNIWALGLLYTSMNLPIAVWMMRSFLLEVPVEIIEASRVDGASFLRQLRSVVMPVISPGIAATALICLIFSWNEFFLAVNLTTVNAATVPIYLVSFQTGEGQFWAHLCAGATLACLPVLIAGWLAQDQLVRGLTMGAVK